MITQQLSLELCLATSSPVSFTLWVSLLSWFIVAKLSGPDTRDRPVFRVDVYSRGPLPTASKYYAQDNSFTHRFRDGRGTKGEVADRSQCRLQGNTNPTSLSMPDPADSKPCMHGRLSDLPKPRLAMPFAPLYPESLSPHFSLPPNKRLGDYSRPACAASQHLRYRLVRKV